MKNMKNVVITSGDNLLVPASVQSKIREAFAFSKDKEIEVKEGDEVGEYDIYQNNKYLDTITE